MLGDGTHNCIAISFADARNFGTCLSKFCADKILKQKRFVDGVIIGRITHGNAIKLTNAFSSLGFGNASSCLFAST